MKVYETALITETGELMAGSCEKSTGRIKNGIIEMWIKTGAADTAMPGQFIMVYPKGRDTILPRPISICEVDRAKHMLRLVYRVQGKGTEGFSVLGKGEEIKILGPLGNGFPLDKAAGKHAVLIGGGIGVPPILELAKELDAAKKSILVGYRDSHMFLKEEFEKAADTYIATEDGSFGTKGNVMDILKTNDIPCDVIYACGPMPMLRAIKAYAEEQNITAYISLEERMACGVGACLGCVCRTTKKDAHSHVNNARVCTEGPVFDAREVEI